MNKILNLFVAILLLVSLTACCQCAMKGDKDKDAGTEEAAEEVPQE